MVITASITIVKKINYSSIYNQQSALKQKRYFQFVDTNDERWSFDMKDKEFFGGLQAINKNKMYGSELYKTKADYFEHIYVYRISIFNNLNISRKEIQKNDFKIKREIYPLLNRKLLNKKNPPRFELYYLKHGLTEVEITYNKEYLPIVIKGYYESQGEKAWYPMGTLSYPYKNKQEFDKKLTDYIKRIKTVENEQEDN